jgi:thiol:disulfide interchange protein DsbD
MTHLRSLLLKTGLVLVLAARGLPVDAAPAQALQFPLVGARSATTPQGSVELIVASDSPARTAPAKAAPAKGASDNAAPAKAAPGGASPADAGELWIALRFQLNPGWHIYWRNPGDSGGPPIVQWHLPPGATAGDFEWPVPARIPFDSLVNFGYEHSAVLPLKITLPAALATGVPFRIDADLKWLVCKDVCVSGKASVGLELPLSKDDRPFAADWADEIATARANVPRPAPRTWTASAQQEEDAFVLTVRMDRAASPAKFFPLEPRQIDNAAPQGVTVNGQELRIRLRKSDQLTKSPAVLRGVLSFLSAPGVTIAAPVAKAAAPAKPPAAKSPTAKAKAPLVR